MIRDQLATWRLRLPRRAPSATERADFYTLLAGFTADGMPAFEALTEIDRHYARAGKPIAGVSARLVRRMRGLECAARNLGEAMAGLVPVTEAMAVSGGEDAGDVAEGLRRAAWVAEVQRDITGVVRRELAYPVALVVMLVALLAIISGVVVPSMRDVMPQEQWPAGARRLAVLAGVAPWLLAGLGVLAAAGTVAFLRLRSQWTGPLRARVDQHLFPFTLHRRVTSALLLASLAALIRIGVPFSFALDRLAVTAGPWEAAHIETIRRRLRRGEREGEALATSFFDPELRWQIVLYGRMTRFAEALSALSARGIETTKARISRSFALLRVAMMVAVAGMIFWIYSAVLAVTLAARG